MLESLEQMNIKRMSVEKPETQNFEDFGALVSDESWNECVDKIKHEQADKRDVGQDIFPIAYYMKIAAPERFEELKLDDKFWQTCTDWFEMKATDLISEGPSSKSKGELVKDFLESAAMAKVIIPGKIRKIGGYLMQKSEITKVIKERLKKMPTMFPSWNESDVGKMLQDMRIAFPEWEFGLSPEDLTELKRRMVIGMSDRLVSHARIESIIQWKVLFPGEALPPEATEEFIQETIREDKEEGRIHSVMEAKMLAAEKILATSEGLKFIIPKPEQSSEKTLLIPDQKQF